MTTSKSHKTRKGDRIQFKKFKWTITDILESYPAGVVYFKYRVHRKYFGIWLSNTRCTYTIFPRTWDYYKGQLEKDKNYHYTQL